MSPDQDPNSIQEPPEERSPLFDERVLIGEAHGNPDLLELIVKREQLMDAGVAKQRQTDEPLSQEYLDEIRKAQTQIRNKRNEMGLEPYE